MIVGGVHLSCALMKISPFRQEFCGFIILMQKSGKADFLYIDLYFSCHFKSVSALNIDKIIDPRENFDMSKEIIPFILAFFSELPATSL